MNEEFNKIWRMMDRFMDCDMDFDELEAQFEKSFQAIEADFYREFFNTLKKTVQLCQKMPCCQPPQEVRSNLIKALECTPQNCPPRKKVSRRKKKS
jgi:hypothetical protein